MAAAIEVFRRSIRRREKAQGDPLVPDALEERDLRKPRTGIRALGQRPARNEALVARETLGILATVEVFRALGQTAGKERSGALAPESVADLRLVSKTPALAHTAAELQARRLLLHVKH